VQKGIAILGSTGSIGTQALEVISEQADHFRVEVLTAGNNYKLLIEQALTYKPNAVIIGNEDYWQTVKDALFDEGIKVYTGAASLKDVVCMEEVDMVLTALVGFAGLEPTMSAIAAGKDIALANKETLVVAGELVTKAAKENRVGLLPVDSEHSAIFQCLSGEFMNPIEKIYLTASGGPFRGKDLDFLKDVKPAQALKHPNWDMGAKITIDSASLMNKGLEVIEAKWLFGLKNDQINVIVHPQSIVHSIVQFEDGSLKAQMGLPDMKLPIQYAMAYPKRLKADFPRFDFLNYPNLTFEQADRTSFRNLDLAFQALDKGGSSACALNAANEITVAAFLKEKIGFLDIARVNEEVMNEVEFIAKPSIDDYLEVDRLSRLMAEDLCKGRN